MKHCIHFTSHAATIPAAHSMKLNTVPLLANIFVILVILGFSSSAIAQSANYVVPPENNETTTGEWNTFVGYAAGSANASGGANTFVGAQAGISNTEGKNNTYIGVDAGFANKTGSRNTLSGVGAGQQGHGDDNTYTGYQSGFSNSGSSNTFIGSTAGNSNVDGSANVFLGFKAGSLETGSNKLYISNSETAAPLIYGEFDNKTVTINGKLGIGGRPAARLDVLGDTGSTHIHSTSFGQQPVNTFGGGYFVGLKARGTRVAPKAVLSNDSLALFTGRGYHGTGFAHSSAGTLIGAAENWSSTNNGTFVSFYTTENGKTADTWSERMRITDAGYVGIGTASPQSKLAVNGKITAKEVEVTITGWPDYVFEKNYTLMPLNRVEEHIRINKHLPGVPSKIEVSKNGVNLGRMDAILLQKIEELTLHVIRQEKQIAALRQAVQLNGFQPGTTLKTSQ